VDRPQVLAVVEEPADVGPRDAEQQDLVRQNLEAIRLPAARRGDEGGYLRNP